jgi:hypothetical protein
MSTPSFAFAKQLEDLQKPASDYIKGLTDHEPALAKNSIKAATLQSDLTLALLRDTEYQAISGDQGATFQPAKNKALAEARTFIGRAKKVLEVHLGADWSEQWGEAGFPNQTIQTPSSLAGILHVLKKMGSYFTVHADQANPTLSVTAKKANQLLDGLSKATTAVKSNADRRKVAKSARDKAVTILRKRLRASIAELDLLIERDSEVWHALGLTPPAERTRRTREKKAAALTTDGTGTATTTANSSVRPDTAAKNGVSLAV